MVKELRDFLTRGNLVDIAVAFILGLAFAAVVGAFTNVVTSLVAAIFGGSLQFSEIVWRVGSKHTPVPIGAFLDALVNFVIVGLIMFTIVKAYNRFRVRAEAGPSEVDLLTEIRDALTSRSG